MTPQQKLLAWVQTSEIPCYEAARRLGMHGATFSRIMHGMRIPTLRQAVRIEAECGICASEWVETQQGNA